VLYTEYGLRECNVIRTRILDRGKHANTTCFSYSNSWFCISLAIRRARIRIGCQSRTLSIVAQEPSRSVGKRGFHLRPDMLGGFARSTRHWKSHDGLESKAIPRMYMDLDVKQIPSLRDLRKINGRRKPDRGFSSAIWTPELLDPVTPLCSRLSECRKTVLWLAPLLQREISSPLVAWRSKANNLSEWHNRMAMPAAS